MSAQPLPVPVAPEPMLEGITVVLPCYDEAENVAAAVAAAQAAALRCAREHEVVVVDDGSRDGTGDIAARIAERDGRVRVVRHERNRGYGAAVRSGFAASRMPWVLLTDGDLQFDLGELDAFVGPALAGHDFVAGHRVRRADPPHRRAAAAAWNRLVDRGFGVGLRDVDCAFKLMRGDALRSLELVSDGAMISTELAVRARLAGWQTCEIGVTHLPRRAGRPTGGDPRVVLRAFRERRAFARALRAEAAGAGARTPGAVPVARAAGM